jgi:cell division protein YceG involved in septum cleavage
VVGKDKKESLWIKVYIILLFFCGIGIWFAMQPVNKQKISIDVTLDKKIIDILVSNGIGQDDIITQYVRERNTRSAQWNEFYKTIKLKSGKTAQSFETGFRNVARTAKVGLSRLDNIDGSVTYKFYSPNRSYYNVTLVSGKSINKRY